MECIIERIRRFANVSDQSISELTACFEPCNFAKREHLIEEGKLGFCAYFIERGMTRSFWLVDGEEVTTSFSTEGAIVFSMDELYYGRLSEEFVEAVEDIEAYRIAIDDLRRLVTTNIELSVWWGAIHEYEYRRLHQSHKERLILPAKKRCEAFRRQFPDIWRRARRIDIASYLGVTPSTLSRIRIS